MNRLNFLQCKTNEELYARQNLLGITENDKIQKIAFGFFLEGNHTVNIDDSLKKKYEHLAGSLSLNTLIGLLGSFLQSELINLLNPHTVNSLQRLKSIFQAAESQAISIDLIRSKNWALNLFAATNCKIFEPTDRMEIEVSELDALVQAHLKELAGLQEGQKAMFLFGTLTHETQVTVLKNGSGWELSYFDSDSSEKTITNYIIEESKLYEPQFWRELYLLKFQNADKKATFRCIKRHNLQDIGDHSVKGKRQRYSTCHILSEIGVMKKEILCHSFQDPNIAYSQWILLKTLFGQHILSQGKITDPTLFSACLKRQVSRAESATMTQNLLKNLSETTEVYLKIFNKLQINNNNSSGSSQLWTLKKLYQNLRIELNRVVVSVKLLREIIGKTNNVWIEQTLERVEKEAYSKSLDVAAKLNEELTLSPEQRLYEKRIIECYGLYNSLCQSVEEIAEKAGITPLENLDRKVINVAPLPRASLEQRQIEEALKILMDQPQRLEGLKYHPACQNVLLQAIQEGRFGCVESLYLQLLPEDKSYLKWLLHNWSFFKPLYSPLKEKYFSEFPDSPLKELL